MLRASLLANAEILPQARQGSYFFNRIGQKRSLSTLTKGGTIQFPNQLTLLRYQTAVRSLSAWDFRISNCHDSCRACLQLLQP
jgi:hypothetical protein